MAHANIQNLSSDNDTIRRLINQLNIQLKDTNTTTVINNVINDVNFQTYVTNVIGAAQQNFVVCSIPAGDFDLVYDNNGELVTL